MSSFNSNRHRFSVPMFNPNVPPPPCNFSMNSGGETLPMQPFQRFSNSSFRPFQSPERFMNVDFRNRSRFSNFSNPVFPQPVFRNRPPSSDNVFSTNSYQHPPIPRFRGSFEQRVRPWNNRPSFPEATHYHSFQGGQVPFKNQHTDLPFGSNKEKQQEQRQKKRNSRKLKDDNTEKPFSCDTCDRAFTTSNELEDHLSLHIKCDEGNCTFEAHPKIVALHKKMQHDTGYADAINKLKNDAEIQKWREERRKRFPTAENVRKRQSEQAEREARGEVLETKEFGKFKRQRTEDGNMRNHRRRRRIRGHQDFRNCNGRNLHFKSHPNLKPIVLNIDSDSDSDSDSHITLKKFSGIPTAINSANANSHTNENSVVSSSISFVDSCNMNQLFTEHEQNLSKYDSNKSGNFQNVSLCDNQNNVLESDQTNLLLNGVKSEGAGSLQVLPESVSNHAVSCFSTVTISDSGDEAPNVMPIIKSKEMEISRNLDFTAPNEQKKDDANISYNILNNENVSSKEDCVFTAPDDEKKNDSAISNNENASSRGDAPKRHQKDKFQRGHPYTGYSPQFVAQKSTLLEKLLADDIRHERNMILQCVRHIVNKNFFGIGSKKHETY